MLLDAPLSRRSFAPAPPAPLPTTSTTSIRILVVDDHTLVRAALRALIDREPDMCVVGEAADGHAAIEAARALRPDVVVMDLSMPQLGGVAATGHIVAAVPGVRVVALAVDGSGGLQAARNAGAVHGVTKSVSPADFMEALRRAAGVAEDAKGARTAWGTSPSEDAPPSSDEPPPSSSRDGERALSRREREVLFMIGQGQARKDMCRQLNVSLRTIETYRARAMQKLSLKSRADIVRYVFEQGWFGE
jgi:DNA-binding NarL/FixJ family response regulator